ncbi:YccT family protein [Photobacterium indicum]|uniref:UPF0319 protein C9J47_09650 n=1 Tax=Photobacterium indicum TaxID=81447 RepID=A0A2T3LBP5_9GAMM|nr:DUF2057 domain-containing protein [Photobacterium indicum]PSV48758.1 hypothetical protein C9J47_09650 [Photobacterium indicum]
MKLKKLALAALLSPLSFQVFADVTVELPENVRLLVVNEQEVNKGWSGFLKASDDSVTLKNGQNQIVYQVDHYFYKGDSQSERYRSTPFVLSFTASDQNLSFIIPNFNDIEKAQQYTKKPTPQLTDKQKKTYPFKHDNLAFDGISINHDYEKYTKEYNKKGGIAALTGLAITTSSLPVTKQALPESASVEKTATTTQTSKTEANLAGDNLKYWFEQADKETRKEFVSWAVQNL